MTSPGQSSSQRGFYISATKKSSGKTVISLGLGATLSQSGLRVQAYKKGPDYIDPMWHQAATGQPCYNLDYFTQSHDEIRHTFDRARTSTDVVYVEGNKGLFDGVDTLGSDSNAALAELLDLPVVLIVNAQGITRGIAPLLSGYEKFSDTVKFAGVILNEVAGPRHEAKLLAAVNEYTNLKMLGVVPKLSKLHLDERHLGLVPHNEAQFSATYIKQVSELVREHVDVEQLLHRSAILNTPETGPTKIAATSDALVPVKIGIARDRAFGFYYPDDLQAMQNLGAELVYFDTLQDKHLPQLDALFIGGGFPETQLDALQSNSHMRLQIRAFIEAGKPVYAECGGLMYLCKGISYQGKAADMVGAIDARVKMTAKPIGRGYAKIQSYASHPWGARRELREQKRCHEFHYSTIEGPALDSDMAYEVTRGYGVNGRTDGIVVKNTLASYCHQRHTENNPWVSEFINFIISLKENRI
jgi:cobyrinic acid a,c-diamide synthase